MKETSLLCLLYSIFEIGITFEKANKYDVVKITTIPTYGQEIFSMTARSKLDCVKTCSELSDCKSAVYTSSSKMCTLNERFTNVSSILSSSSTCSTYYIGPQPTMKTACQSSTECIEDQSECRGNQCLCLPGYSYDGSDTLDCVSSCSSYGTTFQEDVMKLLQPPNSASNAGTHIYTSKTLEECKELCINVDFTCKTIEYDFSISKCFLQSYTYLNAPTWYREDPNYSLFTRDCA